MTYNEWRDELKNNLLTVSDAERRRVLDYYAEAYADRREAGFSEREIIEDFGAPYDAAQRILSENTDDDYYRDLGGSRGEGRYSRRESKRRSCGGCDDDFYDRGGERYSEPKDSDKYSSPKEPSKPREDYTWLFVLLCVLFAVPIFGVVMTMVGVTIGLCVAPFSIILSGAGTIIAGIGELFTDVVSGAISIGAGCVVLGVGIMLFPLFFKLVKWMWKLFNMFFRWLKGLFSGRKERAK